MLEAVWKRTYRGDKEMHSRRLVLRLPLLFLLRSRQLRPRVGAAAGDDVCDGKSVTYDGDPLQMMRTVVLCCAEGT